MYKCNLCGSDDLIPLIDFGNHPVVKHYLNNLSTPSPKSYPVKLYFCEDCGLTQLVDSCPPEVIYDNYVTLSAWKFQPQVQHEIDVVKSMLDISLNQKIIEIGSNDGEFLLQMSENGFTNTLGIEPAKDAYDLSVAKGIKTLNVYLNPQSSCDIINQYGQFDLLISRQNLEHMSDLSGVANSIQALVKTAGYVLIEVPNFACNLRCKDYALWEEHVNYFTIDTLRYFLGQAGVEIIHEEIFQFSGEGIFVIGRKVTDASQTLSYVPALRDQNVKYATEWPQFQSAFREFLLSYKRAGKKIAVYGAGARVFCLINFTGIAEFIDVIVDDQLEKQDKFMPGGKIPIKPSSALYLEDIDLCLLGVNTENEEMVIGKHTKWVDKGGAFWSVLPPSDRLLKIWGNSEV